MFRRSSPTEGKRLPNNAQALELLERHLLAQKTAPAEQELERTLQKIAVLTSALRGHLGEIMAAAPSKCEKDGGLRQFVDLLTSKPLNDRQILRAGERKKSASTRIQIAEYVGRAWGGITNELEVIERACRERRDCLRGAMNKLRSLEEKVEREREKIEKIQHLLDSPDLVAPVSRDREEKEEWERRHVRAQGKLEKQRLDVEKIAGTSLEILRMPVGLSEQYDELLPETIARLTVAIEAIDPLSVPLRDAREIFSQMYKRFCVSIDEYAQNAAPLRQKQKICAALEALGDLYLPHYRRACNEARAWQENERRQCREISHNEFIKMMNARYDSFILSKEVYSAVLRQNSQIVDLFPPDFSQCLNCLDDIEAELDAEIRQLEWQAKTQRSVRSKTEDELVKILERKLVRIPISHVKKINKSTATAEAMYERMEKIEKMIASLRALRRVLCWTSPLKTAKRWLRRLIAPDGASLHIRPIHRKHSNADKRQQNPQKNSSS